MLYSLEWLQQGRAFPPPSEVSRIERYTQNILMFDNDHFDDSRYRHRNGVSVRAGAIDLYTTCCRRISKVVGNFEDVVSVPILLNYQRFMSLKMADLVCGEHPVISGMTDEENAKIKWIADNTNLFAKLYSVVIDISRFGDCPIRIYKDPVSNFYNFTVWDARDWFPIVSQDGTNTITKHCLAWMENRQPDTNKSPEWYLHVQIHDVTTPGVYEHRTYYNGAHQTVIGKLIEEPKIVKTGLKVSAVHNIRAFEVSGTVYGYDDYVPLDSLLSEIITRITQISSILDKHADPSMTGPLSMLTKDPFTGELYLKTNKFYGVEANDVTPEYLVWDGQLSAAFTQLEFLMNQLYILSEMGAALVGGSATSNDAVSGSAMRAKMVNPLAKARRVSDALTLPVRKIVAAIGSGLPEINKDTGEPDETKDDTLLPFGHISIHWEDGLPNDPREQLELGKLASGEPALMALEDALVAYMGKSKEVANELAARVRMQAQEKLVIENEVNQPGPQDGTGVNPQKKGSKSPGQFQAQNNKQQSKEGDGA